MTIRNYAAIAFIVALLITVAGASQASTYGVSGEIGRVDLVNNTIQVGKINLVVSGSSVMLDLYGRRLTLAMLEDMDGPVSVTAYRIGGSYLVKRLQFYDPDEDG